MKNAQYAARPRTAVKADLLACNAYAPTPDCRGEKWNNPNSSSAMYGITSERYDALAVRSHAQNVATKRRDSLRTDRSFRTSGDFLEETKSGNNPTNVRNRPGRVEMDQIDERIRRGAQVPAEITPRVSSYTGRGTEVVAHNITDMKVHRTPAGGRTKAVSEIVAAQTTSRSLQQARKSVHQSTQG